MNLRRNRPRDDTRIVNAHGAGLRLDQTIPKLFAAVSRGAARQAIADGRVFVGDRRIRRNAYIVGVGDEIRLAPDRPASVRPAIDPEILFQDDAIAVVVKPTQMAVEPTRAGDRGTLVRWFKDRGEPIGVVHRLDEGVRGVLVVAKKPFALKRLNDMLRARSITRRYEAIVEGVVDADEQTIDTPLLHRGKMRDARTHVRVTNRRANTTTVGVELETGRTHQIRRHLAGIGHPIVGDVKYGAGSVPWRRGGIALSAVEIAFSHPRTGEVLRFRISAQLD
ncbi:MAG: RluA family pseudouridine synthase [Deltaproteobacteria bacterium]|nr:RluA family pseudouridine synthase [Deltaproteobacteria bacterium]